METIGIYLLNVLIAVLLGILVKYLVPYIKDLILNRLVKTLVYSAEQRIQGLKLGTERKAFVMEQLEKAHVFVDESIEFLIEAFVGEMNILKTKAEQNIVVK